VSRVAVVTGATSGIGRAAALALGDDGLFVVASGRDGGRGSEVERELQVRAGGACLASDLTDDETPRRLVERAREAGALKVVVNCAGHHFLATVPETDPADWDRLMAINLRAAFLLCRAAIPALREAGGGVIVNVASEAGIVAVPRQPAYNVSKAGLLMLSKSIAADHAAEGIRAVSVCPGTTRTPLVENAIASAPNPAAHEEWLAASRPAGRLGTVEEIGRAIAFAASDACTYMTGTEIVVDGGYTAV
jgi:NAD(P)-dependent dehydrogenase (short-subunit alcohol dehydrogenase family)